MKICTIVGARPQFIKAATVSRVLKSLPDVDDCIIHTGQHFDKNMSQVFFDELNITHPRHNLKVGGGTHGQNTGRMIELLEQRLIEESPDWVLLYGDTDSTLAGAISATKLNIKIAHVEGGRRSFNRTMPEEINRILTDHCSDLLFAPTKTGEGQNRALRSCPLSEVLLPLARGTPHVLIRGKTTRLRSNIYLR